MEEIRQAARVFSDMTGAHKMNVAALGKHGATAAYPYYRPFYQRRRLAAASVWSAGGAPEAYAAEALAEMVQKMSRRLNITKM